MSRDIVLLLLTVVAIVSGGQTVAPVPASLRSSGQLTTISPTVSPIPAEPQSKNEVSGLPVGAWVGIGLAIFFVLAAVTVFFIGHKKVSEYFVSIIAKRRGKEPIPPQKTKVILSDLVATRSHSRSSYKASAGSPRTTLPDIPFAPIEIESDGRMSPRLPIASKRGSSTGGTPSSVIRQEL